jgi:hypothetical protein
MQEKNVPRAFKLQIRTKYVFLPRLGIANNISDDASIKRCVFVNRVRRLFEGGALLIISLLHAAPKRVHTVMCISMVAEQFYSWGGGG